ncbi:MAG: MerR family transcriptional regulator, partial [Oscillospiraceae bacterium]|nr:MerR family transcriptional regulator [Oscillospiraceae bacterium]
MKIREVERLVGVSRVNIRFYEREGLLAPARNSANGYRDYSEADVERLKQIKLLRKLDVP